MGRSRPVHISPAADRAGTFPTTLRYDHLYRLTEETKKDTGGANLYHLLYGYDAVGNRTSRTLGSTTTTYGYDNNDKLTTINGVTSCGYDLNGNLTSTSGVLGAWTYAYNDANELITMLPSGSPPDNFSYNALGQRYRTHLGALHGGGTYWRSVFAGDRVLEDTDDAGTVTARYTLTDASYFSPMLHVWRVSGSLSRFPLYDLTGTVRGSADASGVVQETNYLDAFGVSRQAGSGTPASRFTYDGA